MAFFDDKRFLLSHIRHSFITCDDTGMCEMAMLNESMPHHLASDPDAELLDSLHVEAKSELLDAAQSYDIVSDMEMIGAHRRRSNTAQRLERLNKERKSQAKVKVIQWKTDAAPLSDADLRELFPTKDWEPQSERPPPKRSALSAQIEKYPTIPNNPFNEFARFDGRVSEGAPTKRIVIFLTMLAEGDRDYPMEVVSLSSARVQELIGLICWQYTNEGKEPKLKPTVNCYSLRIAEENGDVDPDFPSLNPKEPVAKFGFPVLALVEKEDDSCASLVVTVHIDEMFSKIEAPNLQVTLNWVLEQTLRKRKPALSKALEYRLEAVAEPGILLDPNLPLADVETRDFKLIRDEDSGTDDPPEELADLPDMYSIEAALYKTYVVSAVHRLSRSADVQLGISGKKVDINPLPNKSSTKLWSWQPKAATFPVESIADCEMVKINSVDKATFKLVYHTGTDFQSQRFETDTKTAEDVVKKLKYVMLMRSSAVRDDYTALKEQKLQRKFSSHHLPSFI